MARTEERSKLSRGFSPDFLIASMYLALVPKTAIRSSCAICHRISGPGWNGLPSNRTSVASLARPVISQFHIIQPQVVK